MNMRNDVSVLVSSWNLSFFEHQSSINPNIPLRLGAYYFSTMLKYIDEKEADIYGPGKIILPVPRFHVLYNGSEKAAESEELKLSDLYYNEGRKSEPMLELKVIQHNINGYEDRENSCRQLYEYQWIVETFHRLKGEGLTAEEAIERTIDNLPEDFTIRDLVRLTRSEVIDMWLFEYDEKKHMEMVSRDAEARGELNKIISPIQRQMDKGMTFEHACEILELTEEEIKEVREFIGS